MAYEPATTEELARYVRLLIQLRDIRDFCKAETKQAEEQDAYLWMDTHHTIVESIRLTEKLIGGMMPSRSYRYARDNREH